MKKLIALLSISSLPFNVMADETSISAFMDYFHSDPVNAMDQLPPKEGDDYSAVEWSADDELHSDLRDLIIERSSNDARMFSPIRSNDNPARLVDPGYGLIRNLNELSLKAPNSMKLDEQPWSDTYWPLYSGAAAWRYNDRDLSAYTWQEYYDFSESIKPLDSYPNDQRHLLSPAEKYDLLVGDTNFTLTKRSWDSGRRYYESRGKVERWMGLCHGWAAAAYMLPRPMKSMDVKAPNGQSIKFYPSDIKALGTLLWSEAPFNTRFVGGRCNIKSPEKDENGRVIEPDCVDTNPATWHLSVLNQLGISKRSVIMDATYDYQVWNQPLLGYKLTYFNPQTNRASNDPNNVTIALSEYTKDKFSSYRSVRAESVVGVEMIVEYMVETNPTHREYDAPRLDGVARVKYYYDLELDSDGNAIGGEWYQNRHPDFLWTPTPDAIAKSYYDGAGSWDVKDVVPESWRTKAPSASHYSQPMTSIVSALFAAASSEDDKPKEEWHQLVTNGSQCLDVEAGPYNAGSRIYSWHCHNGDNQLWKLNALGQLTSKVAPDLCLDQDRINITIEECDMSDTQKWRWDSNQLKNGLGNSLKRNHNNWPLGASVQGSHWYWR